MSFVSTSMMGTAPRYLYLARHGHASVDETELSAAGRRQSVLLGERLREAPLSVIHHGPLPRAAQTAKLVSEQLDGIPVRSSALAGDYVPYLPTKQELPPEIASPTLEHLAQFPLAGSQGLAEAAVAQFTGPVDGNDARHELVITHSFLISWLVRDALDAPRWRWIALNHGNAALTVIRYTPNKPASVLIYNDTAHLPKDLRWTGMSPELHI
ncbi:histidine phosphatase family protein [Kribbella sancticallisti]|uniref:Histidine phosphatase family protein n=1 Tax=Kribbella sancticallisti TaxID=460087 RepID=A0ABN2DYL3_9ACTN